MRIGGWLRLWILVGVLWGILVALLGYDMRPKLDHIKSSWVYEATDQIAARISDREGQTVTGYRVRESLLRDYPTDDQVIGWLEQVAAKPKLSQVVFVEDVKAVNAKFHKRIADHPSELREFAFNAFLIWIVPLLSILALGYTLRWVWRGFRPQQRPA